MNNIKSEDGCAVGSVLEPHCQNPELSLRLKNGVTLHVAKVNGGTLFKEYSGKWITQIDVGNQCYFSVVIHNPGQINHKDALRQFARQWLDENEHNECLALTDRNVIDALNDFIFFDSYKL